MSITVSGTVYSDNGVTPTGVLVVQCSINGAAHTQTTTNSSGAYTFTVSPTSGQTVAIYTATSQNSLAVALARSSTSISGLDLYKNQLTYGRGSNSDNITNASLNTIRGNTDAGLTAIISSASSSLCTLASAIGISVLPSATVFIAAAISLSGNVTTPGSFGVLGVGSAITFTNTSGVVTLNNAATFGSLTVNGNGGTVQLGSNITLSVTGTAPSVTIGSGATLDASSSNFNITMNPTSLTPFWSNSGTFTARSSTFSISNTGTIKSGGSSFYNLTVQGIITLQDALFVTNALTINSGKTLDVSSSNYAVSVAGNWSNSGTFTAQNGTVTLNGTNQTISGSTTFYTFVKTTAGTLTITDGTTQTFSNSVSLQNCTITGTSTGGYTFAMPVSGSQTNSGITLSYCTATGNQGVAGAGSVNAGNNVNWNFPAANVDVFPDWLNRQAYLEYVEEEIVNI